VGGEPAYCVDIATDEQNCGACGHPCSTGQNCTGGVCCDAGRAVCDGVCCDGGTECCDGACPFEHHNGLGQTYFACTPTGTHTREAAEEAARAWVAEPTFVYDGTTQCGPYCLGWQTANACAVWCYGELAVSPFSGRVGLTTIQPVCDAACPGLFSPTWE
jgi:hypothetical protein